MPRVVMRTNGSRALNVWPSLFRQSDNNVELAASLPQREKALLSKFGSHYQHRENAELHAEQKKDKKRKRAEEQARIKRMERAAKAAVRAQTVDRQAAEQQAAWLRYDVFYI